MFGLRILQSYAPLRWIGARASPYGFTSAVGALLLFLLLFLLPFLLFFIILSFILPIIVLIIFPIISHYFPLFPIISLSARMNKHIAKPIDMNELFQTIYLILRERSSTETK